MKNQLLKFWIGHGAYKGANRPACTVGKAATVRELRDRGCKRDEARAAVNEAAKNRYITIRADQFGEGIELQLARQGF